MLKIHSTSDSQFYFFCKFAFSPFSAEHLTSVSHLGWPSRAMRLGGLGPILVLLILFSLFLNTLILLDETVSPSRAFQRLITRCEKNFLTSFCHLGLLSWAKWPRVPLLLQSRVNRDSKWTDVNPLYILKSSIKSALFCLSSRVQRFNSFNLSR